MPPNRSAKAERDRKVISLLSFASTLEHRFNTLRDASLVSDLQSQVNGLPLTSSPSATAQQDELDRLGTELWNLSTRTRDDGPPPNGNRKDDTQTSKRASCLLRVFAFFLLDSASAHSTKAHERKSCIRLTKVAVKAAKKCIDSNDLMLATKVLERAADYHDGLDKSLQSEVEEEAGIARRLRVEYIAVRMALAWRQDRMDSAEHLFANMRKSCINLDNLMTESVADLLYEMGKSLLEKRKYEGSIIWLERAFDVLSEKEIGYLSSEAGELRQSTMQLIVQAYMKLGDSESTGKAWNMMGLLKSEFSEKTAVSWLEMELLSAADTFDCDQYSLVLNRMARIIVLNDTNFKTILHCIHQLKSKSPASACMALNNLINSRLLREENQTWIERAVIMRIWMGTPDCTAEKQHEQLQVLLDVVSDNMKQPFSAPATHAAQTLLWKQVEAACAQENWSLAEAWCHICLQRIFSTSGEVNRSKIARKVITCTLARQDYQAALQVYEDMSSLSKDDFMTRYLMYKVALRVGDHDLAVTCLDSVCRQTVKDPTLLYSCVVEAQNAGDRRIAITALGRVIDKYDSKTTGNIHYPALLRCTARLLKQELVRDGKLVDDVLDEICKVFEAACAQARSSRNRPHGPKKGDFDESELEWFSKTTYNLALTHCTEMHPHILVRLLDSCIEFIRLLTSHEKTGDSVRQDVNLRLIFCYFLATCGLTTLARSEDNNQHRLQYYLDVRKRCQNFRKLIDEELGKESYSESARDDLLAKHSQVIKLELEAVLKLKKWDEFEEVFGACWKYKANGQHHTLADLALVIFASADEEGAGRTYKNNILTFLQKIINHCVLQSDNDITVLSRWIRCLFQLALEFDETISLRCLEQAAQIAAGRQGVSHHPPTPSPTVFSSSSPSSTPMKYADQERKASNAYPRVELEWMATTSFNRAIDYYMQEEDGKCKKWAEKALSLAQWSDDNGSLRAMLMERFSGLTWEN
ncbi:SPO22-domain-containing protein [Aaosphaeria arxii CBS 175.79]|uniref:Protein ZIP4 homolog n=1 Tax=Aaosphaeria arxii CBS 175.79 TaxID=1450172 RepID=A0A6A5XWU1_9PLEO|nr:SPO22-domain-containing protein [Aaosphaeria arxii CBS 175.79]KAF2017110.1 SPO22-domain-containing protein [Aaosphaeria arxii CBS 175.79]